MSQIYLVFVMRELEGEGERVVGASTLFLELVLIVDNIVPSPVPADARQFGLFFRINERFHALVIRALRLNKVDKIELVYCVLFGVLYSEVIPLGVDH